jgi:nitrate/nitrite transport system ATP-binding protein
MSFLTVKNLSKSYGAGRSRTAVLKDINLEIDEGEFVAIVGFSGSGKTTLISSIAGLIDPDAGEVRKQGKAITGPGPDRGVVFQNYSLMPWLTVYGNIALSVDATYKHWSRRQRRGHVDKYIELVGLSHAAERRPAELSGGMRQRVNVARALAASPDVLLLNSCSKP